MTSLLTGLAVVAALVGVWLTVPDPPAAAARIAPRGGFPRGGRELPERLRWLLPLLTRLRPRPDAMAAKPRALVGTVGGLGVLVLLGSAPWWAQALLACAVAAGVFFGFALIEPPATARRREQIVLDLPQALDLLGSCLSAGLPLRMAAAVVSEALSGPLAEELAVVSRRAGLGSSERDAWLAMAEQPVLRDVAVDIARAAGTGASLDRALQAHARDARRRRRAQLESRAKTVGVRSVLPLMACFLPAFLLIGIVPIVGGMITGFNFL